jgi:RNA polymerase sigma factor (sigma-70 family)
MTTARSNSESAQLGCTSAEEAGVDKAHADRTAQLFADEYAKLVHFMVARTGSWTEARDVASQAFAQVLEIDDPHTVSFLKGYVYRAARNIWTDRVKIGAIRRRIDSVAHYESATTSPSPEPLLIGQQQAQLLRRAIESLRPSRKMVLIWRIWDELTYGQIALRLAEKGVVVDERTVSNWFADALKALGEAVRGVADADDFERDVE